MNLEQRFQLIKRNTQEIVTEGELKNLLKQKKKPSVYLGWSITGRPHIGYYVPVLKLADFLKAGFKVKLLLADIHGALDNTPWNVLEQRFQHYKNTIMLMFKSIGADIKEFEIVKGSDFQLEKEYILDFFKLATYTSINDARRAGSEVVKFGDNPKLSGLMYPLMQALDEEYLGVDIQYGGIDQRKILMFARENLGKLGYKPRIEVMTPLISGLIGKKMSASDPKSKIDLLDTPEEVINKVQGAYCPEGIAEDNGILAFLKYVIMTLKKDINQLFIVERPEKFGGKLTFGTYEAVEQAFISKKLHPLDLKNAVAKEINNLLEPLQKQKDKLEKIAKLGYG
ncbi:tyrosine--tRNA ligase [Candidatus Woesearchaeota archaeon]|nr:tyrosine--tRNA ligase [Candidatus Woesearchaeota archaeon]